MKKSFYTCHTYSMLQSQKLSEIIDRRQSCIPLNVGSSSTDRTKLSAWRQIFSKIRDWNDWSRSMVTVIGVKFGKRPFRHFHSDDAVSSFFKTLSLFLSHLKRISRLSLNVEFCRSEETHLGGNRIYIVVCAVYHRGKLESGVSIEFD